MTLEHLMRQGRRKLDLDDYRLMDLPNHLWGARFADVPPSIAPAVHDYLVRICKLAGTGQGLLISGLPNTGKSRTTAVIAKEAARRSFSVHWTLVSDLRRDVRARRVLPIDDGTPILERCYEVGLLVLDGFRAEDAKDYVFSARDIGDLITSRALHHRATILTTTLTEAELQVALPNLLDVARNYLRNLLITDGGGISATPSPAPASPPPQQDVLPEAQEEHPDTTPYPPDDRDRVFCDQDDED